MGGPNTVSSSSSPPPEFLQAYKDLLTRANGVANQPLQQYSGQIVAGLSPDQQAAIQRIQGLQGVADPYLNSAAQLYGQSSAPLSTNAAGIASTYGQGATQAAQAAGSTANGLAQGYGSGATTTAEQGRQSANMIAGGAGAAANRAASTDVWRGLPTFQQGVSQYMSPYTDDVVNATQAQFNNQNAQAQQGLVGNTISAGAWGGDRAGVAQGILAGQQALAQAPVIANLKNQGFQQGTQEFNTQQGLQAQLESQRAGLMANTNLAAGGLGSSTELQGAGLGSQTQLGAGNLGVNAAVSSGQLQSQANLGAGGLGLQGSQQQLSADQASRYLQSQAAAGMAGLGSEAQQLGLQGADAQMHAGALEQAVNQSQLNVPYQQFLQQQAYPFQTTQWLGNLIMGLGGSSGGSSSTTSPGADMFSQLTGVGGLGIGAAMLLSDRRAKEGVERIGTANNGLPLYRFRYKGSPTTHVGFIAQDVEKKHPEAVANHGGLKTVDYRKATADAVRKRAGGGGVPDVSLSFIPEGRNPQGRAGGPPRPPPAYRAEGSSSSGLGTLDTLQRLGGYKKKRISVPPPNDPTGGIPGSPSSVADRHDDDWSMADLAPDATAIMPAAAEMGGLDSIMLAPGMFRRGGALRRAGGGPAVDWGGHDAHLDRSLIGDDGAAFDTGPGFALPGGFGPSLFTASGVPIPQIRHVGSPTNGLPSNLTHDYGSVASDKDGVSTLPHTTYWPDVEPWKSDPNNPKNAGKPKPGDDGKKAGDGGDSGGQGGATGGGDRSGAGTDRDEGGLKSSYDQYGTGPSFSGAGAAKGAARGMMGGLPGMLAGALFGGVDFGSRAPDLDPGGFGPMSGSHGNPEMGGAAHEGERGAAKDEKDQAEGPGGGGYDRRGGAVRRRYANAGAVADDDDDDEDTDDEMPVQLAQVSGGPPSPPRSAGLVPRDTGVEHANLSGPFESFPHEGPAGGDAGQGIPIDDARYASHYTPRQPREDTRAADTERAKAMAIMAAGAGILSRGSHQPGVNIGAGALEGLKTYAGLTSQAEAKADRRDAAIDHSQALAEGMRLKGLSAADAAKRFSDQLQVTKKKIDLSGAHMERADQHAADVLTETQRHNQMLESGDYQYIGTDPNAEDPNNSGVYFNKKLNKREYGPAVVKPQPVRADQWDYIGTKPGETDPEKAGVYHNKATNETRYGSVVNKPNPAGASDDPEYILSRAKAIANYQEKPMSAFERKTDAGRKIELAVRQMNPDFNEQYYQSAQTARARFASGPQGNTVRSFNVSLSHLATLDAMAEALNNKDSRTYNRLANVLSSEFGNSAVTSFDVAKKIVADEAAKAVIGSGAGGVSDREAYEHALKAFNTPGQLKDATNTFRALMVGQLHGLKKQYEMGTRSKDFDDYLDDEAKTLLGNRRFAPGQNPNKPGGKQRNTVVQNGLLFDDDTGEYLGKAPQ